MAKHNINHPPRLTDTLRDFLDDWPVGQTRNLSDLELRREGPENAVALGYLRLLSTTKDPSNPQYRHLDKHVIIRTPLSMPVRRYVKAKAGSLWPWFAPQHWALTRVCPMAAQHKMFRKMAQEMPASTGKDYIAQRARIRDVDDAFPVFDTKMAFNFARRALEHLVADHAFPSSITHEYLWHRFCSPDRIYQSCIALLVLPVVQNDHIARFEPIPPDDQIIELERHRGQCDLHEEFLRYHYDRPVLAQVGAQLQSSTQQEQP